MTGRANDNPGYAAHAMISRVAVLVIGSLALLGVAACGGDDSDDEAFRDDFPALSERIVTLGEEAGNTIETAQNATDQELAQEFDGLAQQLGNLRRELQDLEPPDDLADERDDLVSAMAKYEAHLRTSRAPPRTAIPRQLARRPSR